MAIKLGELVIQLTAKADAFFKGMTDARSLAFDTSSSIVGSLSKVGDMLSRLKFENAAQLKRSFDIVSEAAAGLAAGAVVGIGGALAAITEKSIEAGAKLYDLAQATGV